MHVQLEIDNTRVCIREAPDFAIWRLRDALAYLSPSAEAAGFTEPIPQPTDHVDSLEHGWDGLVRFLRVPKARQDGSKSLPWFEAGLLGRAMRLFAELGCTVQLLDFRRRPEGDVPKFWPSAGRDLFAYQTQAVEAAERQGRGVIVAPPRAGKTRILLELLRRLSLPAIFIVPTTSLVDQTRAAALEYGYSKSDVVALDSGVDWKRVSSAALWIATANKVLYLEPEHAKTRQIVIADELHHFTKGGSWGRELHKLFTHVFHWFGATGTFFRSNGDDMALEAFLSEVVYRISSADLLKLGRLVPTRLAFVPVEGPKVPRGADPRRDGLILHEYRNQLVAASALHLASLGRRTLIQVAQKVQGQRIIEMINQQNPQTHGKWKHAEFLFRGRFGNPEIDREKRRRLIAEYLDGSGPAILAGTSLLGEGVDLPESDALVWARGESAAVSYLQGMYRVCTALPGKTDALAVDFADRYHPSLLRASCERLEIAHGDPVFQVQVLGSVTDLGAWAARRSVG